MTHTRLSLGILIGVAVLGVALSSLVWLARPPSRRARILILTKGGPAVRDHSCRRGGCAPRHLVSGPWAVAYGGVRCSAPSAMRPHLSEHPQALNSSPSRERRMAARVGLARPKDEPTYTNV